MDSSYANGVGTRAPISLNNLRQLSVLKRFWAVWFLLPLIALISVLGLGNSAYADEPEMVDYFNITIKVTTTSVECPGGETWVSGEGDGSAGGHMECAGGYQDKKTEASSTAEISVQDGHALVNDAFVVDIEDIKFSITPNGDYQLSVTAGDDKLVEGLVTKGVGLAEIKSGLTGKLKTTTVPHTGNPKEKKYEFTLGEIGSREKKVYGSNNTDKGEANCMNSGAMDTLGWVLCPALSLMSGASQWLYDEAIEPALQVEPKLFTDSDGTMNGWEVFRNIANGFFILLLLVVIFSQITGVGIDNYGIKKILPKLIVAAILMNLSYWICTAFVDLSNIIGNSLQRLFTELGRGLTPPSDIGGVSLSSIGTTLSTSVALLAALFAGIWSSGIGEAGIMGVGLTLVVSAISIIVALFFLFVLLAAREAAVVVLLVISPLAFACYILPNTKKLFDRWWKLGSGLLLVYPICGLLVGGGDFVSKLLLSSGVGAGGFFTAFVAMVAGIAPIFFIPTVLRNSFSAMGNLGARISGMGRTVGNRLSSGTRNAAQGSNTVQRFANAADMRSPFKRTRANAVAREGARMANEAKINRLSDRGNIATRMAAIAASEEAKAVDEATAQRLALMQSAGGGIMMDGGSSPVTFNFENALKRMEQLEGKGRTQALTSEDQLEMAALARGLSGMPGGASKMNDLIRESSARNNGRLNTEFMKAMGNIYASDAAVRSKMNEKDGGLGAYMEQFMPGGGGFENGGLTFDAFKSSGAYDEAVGQRVKSHVAGLNQGGQAFGDYLASIGAGAFDASGNIVNQAIYDRANKEYQKILDDDTLMNSLDRDDRIRVESEARRYGVVGRSVREVRINQGVDLGGPLGGVDLSGGQTAAGGDGEIRIDHGNGNA